LTISRPSDQGGRVCPTTFCALVRRPSWRSKSALCCALVTENLMQLLTARQQAKRLARSSSHTTVEAVDNNPLKFSPSARDALATMFGPPKSAGYLDAQRADPSGVRRPEGASIRTYSAMQHALTIILGDLDPKKIERDNRGGGRALAACLQSRNAKLWDAYKARWDAKIGRKGGDSDRSVHAVLRRILRSHKG
jgi:predicted component of type VI protein secretion system